VCVAVKRVRERLTHELCNTPLTVTVVELDDDDVFHTDVTGDPQDVCRTFSVTFPPDGSSWLSRSCLLHNYLVSDGVLDARCEPDDANNCIVVVVNNDEGTYDDRHLMRRRAAPDLSNTV